MPPADLRLVLDTNVVLDMLHFRETSGQILLHALESQRFSAFVDADALSELARVVNYPKFNIPQASGEALVARYASLSQPITRQLPPGTILPRCRDRDDQKFLETAVTVSAAAVVSKDKDLLRLARRKTIPFHIFKPEAAVLWLQAQGALPNAPEQV